MDNRPSPFTRQAAKSLRKSLTDAERLLWHHIRGGQMGAKFRRQHPFGNYVLDFACLEKRLVIEVDGAQHMENAAHDALRTQRLQEAGFVVLRFWNNEVLSETKAVLERIWQVLREMEAAAVVEPHPRPGPPLEGEGVNEGLGEQSN